LATQERVAQERETELAGRDQALTECESALEMRESELVERAKQLADKETTVTARVAAIETREKSLDAQRDACREREAQVVRQEQSLAERQERVQSRELTAAQTDDAQAARLRAWEEREAQCASRESQAAATLREVEERSARAAQRDADCDARATELERRAAELSNKAGELQHRTAELDSRADELENQTSTKSSDGAEVATLRDQLATQLSQIAELTETREKLVSQLAARREEAQQADEEQAGSALLLAEAERKAKTLEIRTRELEQRQKELERRHQESQRECETLKRRLQSALKESPADSAVSHQASSAAATTGEGNQALASDESDPVARWRAAREQALNSSPSHASLQKPGDAQAQAAHKTSPAPSHGGEAVSVEAYMQQLLARSRRSATPDAPWVSTETINAAVESPPEREPLSTASLPTAHHEPVPLPEPSHRQDKASVRADLDSLRNVANTAARTAIAKYSSRTTREKLLYRSLLATLAVLIAAVLLTSVFWGDGSYMSMGWLAAAAAAALGFDVLRSSGKFRSSRSKNNRLAARTKAEQNDPESKPRSDR
jgi:chromosome segregation ATPase